MSPIFTQSFFSVHFWRWLRSGRYSLLNLVQNTSTMCCTLLQVLTWYEPLLEGRREISCCLHPEQCVGSKWDRIMDIRGHYSQWKLTVVFIKFSTSTKSVLRISSVCLVWMLISYNRELKILRNVMICLSKTPHPKGEDIGGWNFQSTFSCRQYSWIRSLFQSFIAAFISFSAEVKLVPLSERIIFPFNNTLRFVFNTFFKSIISNCWNGSRSKNMYWQPILARF